jgi:uncharacterized protein
VKFWDSSALVPLLVAEQATQPLSILAAHDAELVVWWASQTECVSALARRIREESLDTTGAKQAFERLGQLASGWHEIEPNEILREMAIRFLRVHPLRAADALQLAAAFVASEGRPVSLGVVTLDERLAEAARKEGFTVIEMSAA